MDLGTFSISLAVKDIQASRAFYEKLDFKVIDGDAEQGWLILKNGTAIIGIFQGMFEDNIITFHPNKGIVAIQKQLKAAGIALIHEVEENASLGHITLADPDGNAILIDQFTAETLAD